MGGPSWVTVGWGPATGGTRQGPGLRLQGCAGSQSPSWWDSASGDLDGQMGFSWSYPAPLPDAPQGRPGQGIVSPAALLLWVGPTSGPGRAPVLGGSPVSPVSAFLPVAPLCPTHVPGRGADPTAAKAWGCWRPRPELSEESARAQHCVEDLSPPASCPRQQALGPSSASPQCPAQSPGGH